MKVLVACEFSGVVREAFRKKGHNAWSCDLLPSEIPSRKHFTGNIRTFLKLHPKWDLIVAFPPCTYLCVSGARWFKHRRQKQKKALRFIKYFMNLSSKRIAIENPIGVISTKIRKPDQIVQPYQFGHGETKATCLWLKGLPKLESTKKVRGRKAVIHHMPPSPTRSMDRSRTYKGIAQAMARQWGNL